MKAAILGVTGYTGLTLLRLLSAHKNIDTIIPVSSTLAGSDILDIDRGLDKSIQEKTAPTKARLVTAEEAEKLKPDVVFSALPHLTSAKFCKPFFGKSVIIDLSADFRIKNPGEFETAYGSAIPEPDLINKAVYGLSEIYRNEIEKSDLIANPGCYPTASLLPLIPLAKNGLIKKNIIINALTGISGAGKKPKAESLFCRRSENASAYLPGKTHRHYAEIRQELLGSEMDFNLLFTPHLIPVKRGMFVTITTELSSRVSNEKILDSYMNTYKNSEFIRLTPGTIPETVNVRGTNRCDIGWHIEENNLIIFSAIDNLIKGASGQAVQNMNIRFGFKETSGLTSHGEL